MRLRPVLVAGSVLLSALGLPALAGVNVSEGCVVTSPGTCTYRLTAPAALQSTGDSWTLQVTLQRRGSAVATRYSYGAADGLPELCRLLAPRSDIETHVTATVTAPGTTLTIGDALDPGLTDCAPMLTPATPDEAAATQAGVLPDGVPAGVPPATAQPDPILPRVGGWPFPDTFPRTSGTGRMQGGADLFTNFVLDDHGARGTSSGTSESSLAPTHGTYRYADPLALGNGADIFGSAVATDATATYWRVDWRTLVHPEIPLAVWALDTDGDAATGTASWPAGAAVTSPGLEKALVVSSRGATLIDLANNQTQTAPVVVTTNGSFPGSFVVRIPHSDLPVSGTWRIRLVAGVASSDGGSLAPVAFAQGANDGQPPVYDVAYRANTQETPKVDVAGVATANSWNEVAQAEALKDHTVDSFSRVIDWNALSAKEATAEQQPPGESVRWYASPLEVGPGVTATPSNQDPGRALTYRGRVQPYAYYRPTGSGPFAFVLLHHSLGGAHRQYVTQNPRFLHQLCEARRAVCATPLGYGQDGKAIDAAEVDAWRVVRAAAQADRLDPERYVVAGYSMGGHASFRLGLLYPDVWAAAMVLSGPPSCGIGVAAGVSYDGNGRCRTEADTGVLVGNARWLPLVMADGGTSQIVPLPAQRDQVQRWDDAGFRYKWFFYPAEDHLLWPTKDQFQDQVAALGQPRRVDRPAQVDLTWYPDLVDPVAGIGTTGAWWVRDLVADTAVPGSLATVQAFSAALPRRSITAVRQLTPVAGASPSPYLLQSLTWSDGAPAALSQELTARFANVRHARLALDEAGITQGRLLVDTDRATRLVLSGVLRHSKVRLGAGPPLKADRDGHIVLELHVGRSVLMIQ